MTTPDHSTPHPPIEKIEEAGLAVALSLRAVEVGVAVLIGLLVCPPLLLLCFLVVAPLVVAAIVVSLVAAVLATPYLLVRRLRGHHMPHASVFTSRLRHARRAIVDLLPHRIVREARRERPL